MKIIFDYQIFLLQEFGGISRYICNLAEALSKEDSTKVKIFSPLNKNRHLKKLDKKISLGIHISKYPPKTTKIISVFNKYIYLLYVFFFKPDITHQTYYGICNYKTSKTINVLTVYDMIFEKYPFFFNNTVVAINEKKLAVDAADHIICISYNTKNDIIEYLSVPEEKISVIYLAADKIFTSEKNLINDNRLRFQDYFLFVGKRDGYKNFEIMIRAFSQSDFCMKEMSIICFGGGKLSAAELELITSFKVPINKIHQVDGDDSILLGLYQNASAFIYPSLYEGFGIPLLEAMASKCPVICSDKSSFPEIAGDAALYFDPHNSLSLMHAMEKLLVNNNLRERLIQAGLIRVQKFSWEKCAKETFALYDELIKRKCNM